MTRYGSTMGILSLLYLLSGYALPALCDESAPTATAAATPKSEKHGYWWYEKQPDADTPEDETPAHRELPPPPSAEQLESMYPKDLEKMIEDYRDYALWKQTPEHVAWYYQLQDAARRRSVSFMNVTQYVMLTKPSMNVATDYPSTTPGLTARNTAATSEIDGLLNSQADQAALVLLTRKGCPYCATQRNTLKFFQQRHPNWEVREFDLDESPQIKDRFSTDYTPTTVVIFRGDDQKWFPVSVGVDSVVGVEQGIFRAIRLLHGAINPQTFTMQDYQQGGVMDPQGAPK